MGRSKWIPFPHFLSRYSIFVRHLFSMNFLVWYAQISPRETAILLFDCFFLYLLWYWRLILDLWIWIGCLRSGFFCWLCSDPLFVGACKGFPPFFVVSYGGFCRCKSSESMGLMNPVLVKSLSLIVRDVYGECGFVDPSIFLFFSFLTKAFIFPAGGDLSLE